MYFDHFLSNVFSIQKPLIDSTSKIGKQLTHVDGQLVFDNITFRYPSRPDVTVLDQVSFCVNSGETVAIVGHSGSGKTTIVNLLLRFYDLQMGTVVLNILFISYFNEHYYLLD